MKEVIFIGKNIDRWKKFENSMQYHEGLNADSLAALFIQVTDDLAFAQTFYPLSETTKYLNSLALRAHLLIYKNKKEKKGRILNFFKYDFPLIMYEYRKYIFYSLIIFTVSMLIGAVSAAEDKDFIRLIMGDYYVNNTIENIKNGDPMAVYGSEGEFLSFISITKNNIQVAIMAFVFGILLSAGSAYILFVNGIMLGSFFYFLYEYNALYDASLAIFMHGTLELFAVVVSGAAGILMGNSILFPGTYSRLESFKKGVSKGLQIALGLMPIFIIAGFIEGFLTRHTYLPNIVRIIFISINALFIIWYFFIYPLRIYRKITSTESEPLKSASYNFNPN